MIEAGYDFLDRDEDPLDDLGWSDLFAIPGHGAHFASVIAGRCDADATGPSACGVAPGARVLPLRVARGVVIWDSDRLARAVDYAVVSGAHVIAITAGSPFASPRLEAAIHAAVDAGVIVVAAAGNWVPFVVWPAAFDDAMAVAASDPEDRPWSPGSSGAAVDISAPGAWVNIAAPASTCMTPPCHRTRAGFGTTLATAHVAAIAALWLSFHDRDALLRCYGPAGTARLFRELVVTKGYRRPARWPAHDHGPGIIDAARLLEAELPACRAL